MAVVYKHREKITMPVLHVFQSNAIRLKPGAIYDSIQLYNVHDNIVKNENAVGEKIECYEYDTESRVLFLPDYNFENKVFIKYLDCIVNFDFHLTPTIIVFKPIT